MQNRRSAASRLKLARLSVEPLEDRRLMDAAGLLSMIDPTPAVQERLLVTYKGSSEAVVHEVSSGSLEQAIAGYAADAAVRYVEPDFRVTAAALPNDPYFGNTWGLNNTAQSGGSADADIDAAEAWGVTRGGYGSVIAVIDSGIDYTHADLYQNIWINQGEIPALVRSLLADVDGDGLITFGDLNDSRNIGAGKITDLSGNGYIDGRDLLFSVTAGGWADGISNEGDRYVDDLVGWNFVANTNDPFDDNGHGTHVAGTIAAKGNNGRGVAGVLWDAQLVGLKFLDAVGGGYTSSAVAALNYAVGKSILVSNNSWGGGGYSQALYDAINTARAAGHVFVAAAGNGGSDGVGDNNDASASYPASYNLDNIISVAATDSRDALASFSNYGATSVDVAAPGVGILSTVPGGYSYFSGTSMATPHVTGVVALVQAAKPGLTYGATIAQVLGNVDPLSGLAGKVVTGGRLNAYRALTAVPVDTSAPRVVSATPNATGSNPVSSVRVTFSEAIDPASFTAADITNFVGPNGGIVLSGVTAVPGSGNKSFDVTFPQQSAAGSYRFDLGPDVRDTSGNVMDQDADGKAGESLEDRYSVQFGVEGSYTYSGSPYAAIRDGYATVASIYVDRDITITDVNVKLDISHTYDSDLRVYLIAPDGGWVSLVSNRGGSGDNFRGTVFDDEASTAIAKGRAPFSGTFRPETSLSGFDGKNARGTWWLQVEDWGRGDVGRLNTWSVAFAGAASASSRSLGAFASVDPSAAPAITAASNRFDAAMASGALDVLGGGAASRPDLSRAVPGLSRAIDAVASDAARARLAELQQRLAVRVDQLASRAGELASRADQIADRVDERTEQLVGRAADVTDRLNASGITGQVQTLLTSIRRFARR